MKNIVAKGSTFAFLVMSFAGSAFAADSRPGCTILSVASTDSDKVLITVSQPNSLLCGDNASTVNAYVSNTDSYSESHRAILIAAFLGGRVVNLVLTDTGAECHIDKITMK